MFTNYRGVLGRALTTGALVGVLVAGYQLVVVEPLIDEAIAIEERLADRTEHHDEVVHGHGHGDEALFSRSEQVGGGVAASFLYAVVLAAIFGTVLAATRHRLPGTSDLLRSVWLAAIGFATVALVPAIGYPPNPPGVGDPDTVDQRALQWAALALVGVFLARLLTGLSAELRRRMPDHSRVVAIAAATVAAYGLCLVLFPGTPDVIHPAVPADLVWDFRIRSIGGLALLWAGLGLGLGWFLERDARHVREHETEMVASP